MKLNRAAICRVQASVGVSSLSQPTLSTQESRHLVSRPMANHHKPAILFQRKFIHNGKNSFNMPAHFTEN